MRHWSGSRSAALRWLRATALGGAAGSEARLQTPGRRGCNGSYCVVGGTTTITLGGLAEKAGDSGHPAAARRAGHAARQRARLSDLAERGRTIRRLLPARAELLVSRGLQGRARRRRGVPRRRCRDRDPDPGGTGSTRSSRASAWRSRRRCPWTWPTGTRRSRLLARLLVLALGACSITAAGFKAEAEPHRGVTADERAARPLRRGGKGRVRRPRLAGDRRTCDVSVVRRRIRVRPAARQGRRPLPPRSRLRRLPDAAREPLPRARRGEHCNELRCLGEGPDIFEPLTVLPVDGREGVKLQLREVARHHRRDPPPS